MSEGYEVVVDALTAHSRRLTSLADEIRDVIQPARTRLPADSLGVVGQPFTALLDQLVTAGNQALQAGARAMAATGADVAKSADMFAERESTTAGGFDGIK